MSVNYKKISHSLFERNEYETNKIMARVFLWLAAIVVVTNSLHYLHIFDLGKIVYFNHFKFTYYLVIGIWAIKSKSYNHWMKYVLLGSLLFFAGMDDIVSSFYTAPFILCPLLLSAKYYTPKMTMGIIVITVIMLFFTSSLSFYLENHSELIDKYHHYYLGLYKHHHYSHFMYDHFLCKIICYILPAMIAFEFVYSGKKLFREQSRTITDSTTMHTQMRLAAEIQKNSLPDSDKFTSKNFDINTLMIPARETAGDFYDFYWLNKDTFVVCVADVSDKGLPSAMFMMSVRNAFRGVGLTVNEISSVFTMANNLICEENPEGMFVTLWMAFINKNTGKGKFVNAGHLPPILKKADGTLQYLENKPQPFLGMFENIAYEEHEFQLHNGDTLCLFTDGVTDAINKNDERFELKNLEKSIATSGTKPKEICTNIKTAILDFANGEEQFDDITILALQYKDGNIISLA